MRRKQIARQSEEVFTSEKEPGRSLPYLLFRPDEDLAETESPLLMFLHGAGERGRQLEAVKRHGPPKLIEADPAFPFLTVSPQCPDGRWWQEWEMLDLVNELLDDVVANYPVDSDRIYLTGISMGGFGAWWLASHYPQKFAAVVPICGGGDPERAHRLVDLPIWAFHGEKDDIVPVDYSQEMVEAIRQVGGDSIKLTIYPNGGHDSWTATYKNREVFRWLLEQRRLTP